MKSSFVKMNLSRRKVNIYSVSLQYCTLTTATMIMPPSYIDYITIAVVIHSAK